MVEISKRQLRKVLLITYSIILFLHTLSGQNLRTNRIDTFEITKFQYFNILDSDTLKYSYRLTREHLQSTLYEVCYPDGVFKSMHSLLFDYGDVEGNSVCFTYNFVGGSRHKSIKLNEYDEILNEINGYISDTISNSKLYTIYQELTRHQDIGLSIDLSHELNNIHHAENMQINKDTSKIYFTPDVYNRPNDEIELAHSALDTLLINPDQRLILYKSSNSKGKISNQKLSIFPKGDITNMVKTIYSKFYSSRAFHITQYDQVFLFRTQTILDDQKVLQYSIVEHSKKEDDIIQISKFEIQRLN